MASKRSRSRRRRSPSRRRRRSSSHDRRRSRSNKRRRSRSRRRRRSRDKSESRRRRSSSSSAKVDRRKKRAQSPARAATEKKADDARSVAAEAAITGISSGAATAAPAPQVQMQSATQQAEVLPQAPQAQEPSPPIEKQPAALSSLPNIPESSGSVSEPNTAPTPAEDPPPQTTPSATFTLANLLRGPETSGSASEKKSAPAATATSPAVAASPAASSLSALLQGSSETAKSPAAPCNVVASAAHTMLFDGQGMRALEALAQFEPAHATPSSQLMQHSVAAGAVSSAAPCALGAHATLSGQSIQHSAAAGSVSSTAPSALGAQATSFSHLMQHAAPIGAVSSTAPSALGAHATASSQLMQQTPGSFAVSSTAPGALGAHATASSQLIQHAPVSSAMPGTAPSTVGSLSQVEFAGATSTTQFFTPTAAADASSSAAPAQNVAAMSWHSLPASKVSSPASVMHNKTFGQEAGLGMTPGLQGSNGRGMHTAERFAHPASQVTRTMGQSIAMGDAAGTYGAHPTAGPDNSYSIHSSVSNGSMDGSDKRPLAGPATDWMALRAAMAAANTGTTHTMNSAVPGVERVPTTDGIDERNAGVAASSAQAKPPWRSAQATPPSPDAFTNVSHMHAPTVPNSDAGSNAGAKAGPRLIPPPRLIAPPPHMAALNQARENASQQNSVPNQRKVPTFAYLPSQANKSQGAPVSVLPTGLQGPLGGSRPWKPADENNLPADASPASQPKFGGTSSVIRASQLQSLKAKLQGTQSSSTEAAERTATSSEPVAAPPAREETQPVQFSALPSQHENWETASSEKDASKAPNCTTTTQVWDPATGEYIDEELPDDIKAMMSCM